MGIFLAISLNYLTRIPQEQLFSWKQLEVYNYFKSGYVRTVYAMAFGQDVLKCILVKAKVNPSQCSPDDAHEAWIIAKPDGCIVSAHCTCKAA